MSQERQRGYRFGPRDQRGLFPSLHTLQILSLGSSVVCAVAIARLSTSQHRLIIAFVLVVVAAVISLVRIAGRSLVEWLPEIGAYVSAGVTGNRRVTYRSARGGFVTRTSKIFGSFRFLDLVHQGRRVGAIYDCAERTLSAVLEIDSEQFSLLDEETRRSRVSEWSSVLAAFNADRALYRLKWIVQTMPDSPARYRASIARATAIAGSISATDAVESYSQLCEDLQRTALRTEQFVVVSARFSPTRSKARVNESASPEAREIVDFARQVGLVERRLAESGLHVRAVYSKRSLIKMTQQRFDASDAPLDYRSPWPVALEERWESIRTDNLWHCTYWIAEWPKTEVSTGFLLPLLGDTSVRKNISLAMTPIHQERATRTAERRRTSSIADAEMRRRYGFALSSRIRSQHEAVVQREEELASGHVGYEFSGYVTVSATSVEELQRACETVEQSCSLAHLEIRRLYGMQRASLLFGFVNARGCQ
ncbi:MAG TPA: SCO6880 family protein [Acidimicrobiales bacterium]|nr:SCO6880 family protein [Acidimicrobiales bacterium]